MKKLHSRIVWVALGVVAIVFSVWDSAQGAQKTWSFWSKSKPSTVTTNNAEQAKSPRFTHNRKAVSRPSAAVKGTVSDPSTKTNSANQVYTEDTEVAERTKGTDGSTGEYSSQAMSWITTAGSGLKMGSLAAGGFHSLQVKFDGTAWASGWNANGQLGRGNNNNLSLPHVVLANNFNEVPLMSCLGVAAGFAHTVALRTDGSVWTWGSDANGQLGDGGANTDSSIPVRVTALTNMLAVAAGSNHCLAVRGDGTVWTWGLGTSGQLGQGSNLSTNVPVRALVISNTVVVAGGNAHSLALRADGSVWSWGLGTSGQLGRGNTLSTNRPDRVNIVTNIVSVAAGDFHSLAVRADGTVWAWGLGTNGQLGNGNNTSTVQAIQISGLSGVMAVAGGGAHSLGLKGDGTVWSWGLNSSGQLGNNSTTSANTPVLVSGLTGAIAIHGERI